MARLEDIRDALARECMAETLAGAELRADIQQTLLPDEYQCFWLWLEGFPTGVIGSQLGISQPTAWRRVQDAVYKITPLVDC